MISKPATTKSLCVQWLRRFHGLIVLWFLAAGIPILAQKTSNPPSALKFVVLIIRHGVRSPTGNPEQLNQYSVQPWPKWDVPPGYLTPQGAKLMTLFGAYYRSYFGHHGLLSERGCADAARVSFYSDSDQRTVETGKSLAAGMFPGCSASEQSEQHALAENQPDPLFHALAAGTSQPDRERAVASIAGRIAGNPASLTEVYGPQLEQLQRILLACPTSSPCPDSSHAASKLLLQVPATLEEGKGDHPVELKGPLNTASTITENFLLEFASGMPPEQVGWGRVDLATLKQLMVLHTAASDLTRRSSYLAVTQASNELAHIVSTLKQAVTGNEVPGSLGKPGDRALILVGHDTNLANIAGTLGLNWLVDGRLDDTPPGGALVFELWDNYLTSSYEVRTYYIAQTLEQMRNVTALTLANPPARANVFVPGCSNGKEGFPCDWKAFEQVVNKTIDPAFVK
jgi:4-phytase / acid phosphatase